MQTTRPALYRRANGRVLAGVAAGIADHLQISVLAVRAAFVVLTAFSGFGAVLYVVYWIVLPRTPGHPDAVLHHGRGRDIAQLVAFGALALGVALLSNLTSEIGVYTILGWMLALAIFGGGIIWHQAEPDRWRRWGSGVTESSRLMRALSGTGPASLLLRLFGGGVLMIVGVIGIIALVRPIPGGGIPSLLNGLLFALFALVGLALAIGPLLW
nr:PspC domain-containing protein [Longispora sp. (in: high G+C Gram-positive bacteria)]